MTESPTLDLDALSDDAKAMAGAHFGLMMWPRMGMLTFQMVENRPNARGQAALDELVAKGVANVEPLNDGPARVYRPLVRCDAAYRWFAENLDKASFAYMEPVPKGGPETIPEYLARMTVKDRLKGGDGLRSTRQVADYFSLTTKQALRRLERLYDADEIGCAVDGRFYYWHATTGLQPVSG
ncbi:hypothetical protein [Phenylobacterium ferrooxidans]|uniref:Uncharacterized protein n=1 Tax=Phenylobacterium ferrooxidans TaxID=2982689 RepID=A0ABW6CMW6_9CAUL